MAHVKLVFAVGIVPTVGSRSDRLHRCPGSL